MVSLEVPAVTEDFHRDLLNALPFAVYATDRDGVITFCNEAAAKLAGRMPALGEDRWCVSSRLYDPEGNVLPHDQCPMATMLRERRPISDAEVLVERPDGTRLRCAPHPVPLFDSRGEFVGGVNVLIDLSEPSRASIEAAHLAAIVSSSDDAIVSKSLDGIVHSWNAGASRIFGYLPTPERVCWTVFATRAVMPNPMWRGRSNDRYRSGPARSAEDGTDTGPSQPVARTLRDGAAAL